MFTVTGSVWPNGKGLLNPSRVRVFQEALCPFPAFLASPWGLHAIAIASIALSLHWLPRTSSSQLQVGITGTRVKRVALERWMAHQSWVKHNWSRYIPGDWSGWTDKGSVPYTHGCWFCSHCHCFPAAKIAWKALCWENCLHSKINWITEHTWIVSWWRKKQTNV